MLSRTHGLSRGIFPVPCTRILFWIRSGGGNSARAYAAVPPNQLSAEEQRLGLDVWFRSLRWRKIPASEVLTRSPLPADADSRLRPAKGKRPH